MKYLTKMRKKYENSKLRTLQWMEFWSRKIAYTPSEDKGSIQAYYLMLGHNNKARERSFLGWYLSHLKGKFEMTRLYQAYLNLYFRTKEKEIWKIMKEEREEENK